MVLKDQRLNYPFTVGNQIASSSNSAKSFGDSEIRRFGKRGEHGGAGARVADARGAGLAGDALRLFSQRFDFIRRKHTTVYFKAFLGKDSHTSWDDERAGDAGVEGGELESMFFREGEKVGVGGVLGVLAPGGKVAAG